MLISKYIKTSVIIYKKENFMSRTAVLTKQQIIKCAYDIANKKGKAAITIREIANQLGKSTAPIYTQYTSIDAYRPF